MEPKEGDKDPEEINEEEYYLDTSRFLID